MGAVGIVGAQWGSEGKGVVAHALAGKFDAAVRVGGPNAGHSFNHDGVVHKMRGVPCAWVNPECALYVGAGAVVDPVLLSRELDALPEYVVVTVDANAVVLLDEDAESERQMGIGRRIGSTTEGVGVSRSRKIERNALLARDWPGWHDQVIVATGVGDMLWRHLQSGQLVMLEGTQGQGLSLHHGTQYPYVTSADTGVAQMAADSGVAPSAIEHTFLVARTLPIRVGGQSGPMGEELEWAQVAEHVPGLVPERTTVTNRERRISRWHEEVFTTAVRRNGPCGIFLMFADYLVPTAAGTTDERHLMHEAYTHMDTPLGDLLALSSRIETFHRIPIMAYGTGGPTWSLAWRGGGRCAHGEVWSE